VLRLRNKRRRHHGVSELRASHVQLNKFSTISFFGVGERSVSFKRTSHETISMCEQTTDAAQSVRVSHLFNRQRFDKLKKSYHYLRTYPG
jgi:hypothetical protein